jgi:hypothetical protein
MRKIQGTEEELEQLEAQEAKRFYIPADTAPEIGAGA